MSSAAWISGPMTYEWLTDRYDEHCISAVAMDLTRKVREPDLMIMSPYDFKRLFDTFSFTGESRRFNNARVIGRGFMLPGEVLFMRQGLVLGMVRQ